MSIFIPTTPAPQVVTLQCLRNPFPASISLWQQVAGPPSSSNAGWRVGTREAYQTKVWSGRECAGFLLRGHIGRGQVPIELHHCVLTEHGLLGQQRAPLFVKFPLCSADKAAPRPRVCKLPSLECNIVSTVVRCQGFCVRFLKGSLCCEHACSNTPI